MIHKFRQKAKIVIALSMTLLIGAVSHAVAKQSPIEVDVYYAPMKFVFDGKEFAPPMGQQGFIYEGSSYVPLRFVAYSLNKAVSWDPDTYTVSVKEPAKTDLITISEYNLNTEVRDSKTGVKADTSKLAPSKIQVYKEQVSYVFDKAKKETSADLPGFIIDGSLYVPMRFFSESVGQKIDWDPVTYTVSAAAAASKQEETKPVPTATPTPTPKPPVMGGGGGPVAPVPSKPSFESLKADVEGRISSLEISCSIELFALWVEHNKLTDDDAKAAKKAEGQRVLDACDASFEQMMTELESKLIANGYDTGVIAQYQLQYEEKKEAAKNSLKQQ